MKQHNYCRHHTNRTNWGHKSKDPKDDCPYCIGIVDRAYSYEIYKAHVYGKWCKEHNQCSICCEIKHYIRILKHYGEICSPKKCPVCEWSKHSEQKWSARHFKNPKSRFSVVKNIYAMMLGAKKATRRIY